MRTATIRSILIGSAASLAIVASVPALAADMKESKPAQTAPSAMKPGKGMIAYQFRASEIIGKTVKNAQDETLGDVDDLILGRDDKVVYAIISVGGFLGLGDKLVAVRYDELKHDGKDNLVFNATKEQLKARPAFTFETASATPANESADAYRKRMAGEIDEWKTKVDDYSAKAKKKGTEASTTAAKKLDSAWDGVKTQWNKLQNATDETWQDTKAAFEKAWDNFQDTWDSATSDS